MVFKGPNIDDLVQALAIIQTAIDDFEDANAQLEKLKTILFTGFGLGAEGDEWENKISEIHLNTFNNKEMCNAFKNQIALAKTAYEQADNEIAKSAEMWK